jgi:hypothetical protein
MIGIFVLGSVERGLWIVERRLLWMGARMGVGGGHDVRCKGKRTGIRTTDEIQQESSREKNGMLQQQREGRK